MNTKKLKELVLDLAIHGKLVPQDPNDEPASVLLERIRNEKERLVKEGKIKKSKSTTSSDTPPYENVPFEVPNGWCWCRMKEICRKLVDGDHNPPKGENKPTKFLMASSKNINNDSLVNLEDVRFLSEVVFKECDKRTKVSVGDIAITSVGTLGRSCIIENDYNLTFQRSVTVITLIIIHNYYVKYYLDSAFIQNFMYENAKGTAQQGFYINQMEELLIPLPPLAEQQRIVAEIERWFVVIDALESNEGDLLKSIEQTKKKVLDLAIHGKLVPQDPNDEPANELLKRLGVSSYNRPYENVPFEVPNGWCWCRGNGIFHPMESIKPSGDVFKYIDIDSIDNKLNKITPKLIDVKNAPSRATRKTQKGDILFSMVRPYLRNIAQVDEDECIASTGFFVCKPKEVLSSDYCFYMMISAYVVDGLNSYMKGDNSPSINNQHIQNWAYPLPPLAEQQRIVAKIEELYKQLDAIATSLQA